MTNKPLMLLVDSNALTFRGFFATYYGSGPVMSTSYGLPVNSVYQYTRYLINAIQYFNPTHIISVWDTGKPTFRHELYKDYKGTRKECPLELLPQFSVVKELVESFGIPNIEMEGFEADDCIGTLARQYSEQGIDVLILTGDYDALQLVNNHVKVAIMQKGIGNYKVYCPQLLMEEKGLTPAQFIDLKALMGDPSDNYPGIKGCGEKSALKLLLEHGDIDGILVNISTLTPSMQKKLNEGMDMLQLCRRLAKIRQDVPIAYPLEEALFKIESERVRAKFEQLEIRSLMRLVEVSAG